MTSWLSSKLKNLTTRNDDNNTTNNQNNTNNQNRLHPSHTSSNFYHHHHQTSTPNRNQIGSRLAFNNDTSPVSSSTNIYDPHLALASHQQPNPNSTLNHVNHLQNFNHQNNNQIQLTSTPPPVSKFQQFTDKFKRNRSSDLDVHQTDPTKSSPNVNKLNLSYSKSTNFHQKSSINQISNTSSNHHSHVQSSANSQTTHNRKILTTDNNTGISSNRSPPFGRRNNSTKVKKLVTKTNSSGFSSSFASQPQYDNPALEFFKAHWEQIKSIILGSRVTSNYSNYTNTRPINYQLFPHSNNNLQHDQNVNFHEENYCAQADEVSAFGQLLEKMVCLLCDEERVSIQPVNLDLIEDRATADKNQAEPIGPILEYALEEEIFDLLTSWSNQPTNPLQMNIIIELLKMYETIVNEAQLNVLHQWPVVDNLMKLLKTRLTLPLNNNNIGLGINQNNTDELDLQIVTLINVLCARIQRDKPILNMMFATSSTETEGPYKLLIFALLMKFMYKEDNLGSQSKDALLLLLSLTLTNKQMENYVHDSSSFSLILVSGITALYSKLPNQIPDTFIKRWHLQWTRLEMEDLRRELLF